MKKLETEQNYIGEWVAYDPDESDGTPQPHGTGKTKEEAIQDYYDTYGE